MTLKEQFASTLAAARTGAPWAWESIYRDLAGVVGGYLRGRGAPEVEDLVSETFLSVARDIHSFCGDESAFRSWVFTIAHRRMLDAWRSQGRRVPIADGEDAQHRAERKWRGDVEDEAMNSMSAVEAEALMGHLTRAQRDVILLRVVGDLSVAQTARILDTSEGAVRALQNRALRELRKVVGEDA
ncbi:RNA polymerase sigma factor [Demequina lutea]|uniref:RNA polymerase sigma-70 factor (ECF subfamily) n=1 Tax=Demequina lutea TaxID=431489 RepID=A0A7Y9ZAZ8_9MICO|nr:RNA polymerase sigma factor [Demequina lutea]NYI40913.1 RNA polymerase sigma-70 factor (ECF subfamily) [Demequina lutea]